MNLIKAKILLFTICLLFPLAAAGQIFYGSSDVKAFRAGREKEMRNKEESPLKEDDFKVFKGLNYFPLAKAFRVSAVFNLTSDKKSFFMPTSTGKTKKFIKFGTLSFTLQGKNYVLSAYQPDAALFEKFPEYKDLLFVPFKDLTNGSESYGGGRYIDIKIPNSSKIILDFNLAYNPSCAYGNDKFSCPIPPRENFLQAAIKAGEKSYQYSKAKID